MDKSVFIVPDQYAGKTLTDIQGESGLAFRADVLGGFVGVDPRTPLSAGQTLRLNTNDYGSGEVQAALKLFGQGQNEIDYQLTQAQKQLQDANKPLVAEYTRQGQVADTEYQNRTKSLNERYQEIIAQIRQGKEGAINKANLAAAQEYGKRGIPLSSGDFEKYQQAQAGGIGLAYDQTLSETAYNQESQLLDQDSVKNQRQNALNELLAQLQSGASKDAINLALNKVQLAMQSEESAFNRSLQQQQLDLQKSQSNKQETQLVEVGGRIKLINSQTGATISDLGAAKSGGGGGTGTAAERLQPVAQQALDAAAKGSTLTSLQQQFGGKLGTEKVVELYNSVSPYGAPKEEYARKILDLESTADAGSSDTRAWWQKALGVY